MDAYCRFVQRNHFDSDPAKHSETWRIAQTILASLSLYMGLPDKENLRSRALNPGRQTISAQSRVSHQRRLI